MCQHEIKQCPRCHSDFECKTNNVLQCQCVGIPLSETQRSQLADEFGDCLCAACLHYYSSGQNRRDQLIAERS